MALFARLARLFRRTPQQNNSNMLVEMQYLHNKKVVENNDTTSLNEDSWEYVSREDIAAADQKHVAIMYKNLDAEIAAARNEQCKNPIPFAIGEREEDGFIVLETQRETALDFEELLDEFNTHETSFMF